MYSNSVRAYETVDRATMSGRNLEAAVLTKAAQKLKKCQDNWESADLDKKLDEILTEEIL